MLVGLDVGKPRLVGHGRDLRRDTRGDRLGDLVLQREDAAQRPVEGIAPQLHAIALDELRRDPELLPVAPHAALQEVLHPQECANARHVVATVLQGEGRGARDHLQLAERGQPVEDFLGDAVGEIDLLRIAAQVGEGQHRHRVLDQLRRTRPAVLHKRRPQHAPGRVVDDQAYDQHEGRQDQVVGTAQWHRGGDLSRRGRRLGAADPARRDLEDPAEHERHREPQHARPEEVTDRRVGNPPAGEQDVGGLHQQPHAHHV